MFSKDDAQARIEFVLPGRPIKAWAQYRNVFLFRIEHFSEHEKDFDPFFSVDMKTGEVRDFSVITDGDLGEIMSLEWTEV